MTIDEFKVELFNDLKIASEENSTDLEREFIDYSIQRLIDADIIEDFQEGFFENSFKNRKIQIDGYSIDNVDSSFYLYISDFTHDHQQTTLTKTDIDKLYNRLKTFVDATIDGYIKLNCEASSIGYEVADLFNERKNFISKIRFVIITDKVLSDRVKKITKDDMYDLKVEVNVWDLSRIFQLVQSERGLEPIEIDLSEYANGGLNAIKATNFSANNYDAYLTAIPGDVLAKIYLEYGSRLLEGNVRSFLSLRGKVNKNIRNTILHEPEMFFAFNNGIAATVEEVDCIISEQGLLITRLKDFQIINGGQTTASIANVILNDKKDVSKVLVPMKISVVDSERAEEIIPRISRSANSQNTISDADFFSNSPYHRRLEELSRKIYAPAIGDNQYQTIWFYERARGQYQQEQMKLTTSERNKYKLKNPKNQVITKTDVAKFINSYEQKPHLVSRGAQANIREFAKIIDSKWEKDNIQFNELYYRELIAKGILFIDVGKIVSSSPWYKKINAYRANIVTYTIAVLSYVVEKKYKNKEINLRRIWQEQNLYPEFVDQINVTSEQVLQYITREDRETLNVTEWCKKELCWERAKKQNWILLASFEKTLVDSYQEEQNRKDSAYGQKVENELSIELEVYYMGIDFWKSISLYGITNKLVTDKDMGILKDSINKLNKNSLPSNAQCKYLLKLKERLELEGFRFASKN